MLITTVLGNEKTEVDKITGLSPVVSIERKQQNPRSTVGTITEIYDYLRLLYSRAEKHIHTKLEKK